ncbi:MULTISPECIES: hypothetical protein [Streptosporangium]|uniref:Uncharacterized protein n=1 Tax=Streptosporangium brasiliense TaxID=47480 RepID=A0ABT9R9V0_9ACTN|nr:hypothetical protein [Streptosporangium brasiliense]MDP9866037.1 hypothetical protein [Streptosporangium brasiliense]
MGSAVIGEGGCLSPHVVMPLRDHMRLVWHAPYKGVTRLRVNAWTCHCRATMYELCHAGGQAFIRRTLQLDDNRQVHETYRWPIREADDVWRALLSGKAR